MAKTEFYTDWPEKAASIEGQVTVIPYSVNEYTLARMKVPVSRDSFKLVVG